MRVATLVESQYILSKEEMDLKDKFQRYEAQSLQSVIVQRDEDTLIVSQHIPQANDTPKLQQQVNGSYSLRDTYIKPTPEEKDEEILVSQLVFNKRKDGPLLDMFESPMFNVHMIFKYLHTLQRPNLIEYLMNKMYREHRNEIRVIDFYLPQLW